MRIMQLECLTNFVSNMANEFAFMFIDIEDTMGQYKEGMIGEDMVVEKIQRALNEYKDNTSERATVEW